MPAAAVQWTWTDERIEALKAAWNYGLTCSQIADITFEGTISRNAVIGKVNRLGLMGRQTAQYGKGPRQVRKPCANPVQNLAGKPLRKGYRHDRSTRASAPAPQPERKLGIHASFKQLVSKPGERKPPDGKLQATHGEPRIPFGSREPGQCAWIPGDVKKTRFGAPLYCGLPVVDHAHQWCAAHAALGYSRAA